MKIFSFLLFIMFFISSCRMNTYKSQGNDNLRYEKSIYDSFSDNKLIKHLENSMVSYMLIADNPYSHNEINESISILKNYTEEINHSYSKEEGLEIIKKTILALNNLNKKCNGILIETDQREMIAEYVNRLSIKKGYSSKQDDVTFPLRDW